MDDLIHVICKFIEHNGKKTLVPDDTDVEEYQRSHDAFVARLQQDADNVQDQKVRESLQEQIDRASDTFQRGIDRIRQDQHDAEEETVYAVEPYSAWDRAQARQKYRTRDAATSEVSVDEEMVTVDLVCASVRNKDGVQLSPAERKKISGPVANRIWRELSQVCEPRSIDYFRD